MKIINMKTQKTLILFLTILSVTFTVSGELKTASACERAEVYENRAEKSMNNAESEQEREKVERKFSKKIKKARELCENSRQKERFSRDILEKERCQEKASNIRNKFLKEFKESSFVKTRIVVKRFLTKQKSLLDKCPSYKKEEKDSKKGFDRKITQEDSDNYSLEYDLPRKTADACRSKVEKLEKQYEQRMQKTQEPVELRKEFYKKVPEVLESCDPPPKLVNVSEAPNMISESCKKNLKDLNQEIMSESKAEIGSSVPESYRSDYKKTLRRCTKSTVVQKVKERILGEVLGKDKKLKKRLERKERRIKNLERRVNKLSQNSSYKEQNNSEIKVQKRKYKSKPDKDKKSILNSIQGLLG